MPGTRGLLFRGNRITWSTGGQRGTFFDREDMKRSTRAEAPPEVILLTGQAYPSHYLHEFMTQDIRTRREKNGMCP